MSDSIWNDPRITAYVLGELPEDQRNQFESEIESSSELAAAVEEARSVTGQLEVLYAAEPTEPLDPQRRESIASSHPVATPTASESRSWKIPMLLLATAAALLVLVGLGPWLKHQQLLDVTVSQFEGDSAGHRLSTNGLEEMLDERSVVATPGEQALEFGDAAGFPSSGITAKESMQRNSQRIAPAFRDQNQRQLSAASQPAPAERPVAGPQPDAPAADAPTADASGAESPFFGLDAGASGNKPSSSSSTRLNKDRGSNVAAAGPENTEMSRADSGAESRDDAPAAPGDTQVQFVPESGTIVMRGAKRDVERTKQEIKQIEEQSAPRPELAGVELKYRKLRETEAKNESGNAADKKQMNDLAVVAPAPAPAPAAPGRIVLESELRQAAPQLAKGRGRMVEKRFLLDADYALPIDEGRGPGIAGDRFEPITDNPFKRVSEHPLSTFSVDVDTASYSKTRDFLMRANQLPRPDSVRIEELLNYFDYDYAPPSADDKHPFAARVTVTSCPWNHEHRLARIALKGKTMDQGERPACNLVFLLDTSGSMNAPNKLPLVIEGMKMLVEQLDPEDHVAITVYAGSAGLVLDSTRAKKSKKINKALGQLSSGGSTNGGAGIALAYQTARENFISEGVNRVILCTDGDFNVGTTGTDELVRMVEQEAKGNIFLSVLGFGMGNHNDAMLEKISGRGNGNYAFIDGENEARKVLVNQTSGTLVTIAKDVKLQIEFNPTHVSSYRLIGYENRVLAKEDFNDDKKDAGEIGAGHSVTALYEIIPPEFEADISRLGVDPLKYQNKPKSTDAADSEEMMTLKLRYKQPDGDTSTLVEFPVVDDGGKFDQADDDVRFAAAVAGFGMQLRRSEYRGRWTIGEVLKVAEGAKGEDAYGLRAEFVQLVRKAGELMGHPLE